MKNYFKCLWQRRLLIIILMIVGLGLASLYVYSYYNPRHEVYELTFKYDTIDFNIKDIDDRSFIKNVKNEIQTTYEESKSIVLNDYKYPIEVTDTIAYTRELTVKSEDGYTKKTYSANYEDISYDSYKNIIVVSGETIQLSKSDTVSSSNKLIITHSDNKKDTVYCDYNNIKTDSYVVISDYWYPIYNAEFKEDKKNKTIAITKDNITETIEATWNGKYTYSCNYSSFDYIKVKGLAKGTKYKVNDDNSFTLICQQRYFNTWQQARRFMMRMANDLSAAKASFTRFDKLVTSDSNWTKEASVISSRGGISMAPYAVIGAASGLLVGLVVISILVLVKKEDAIDKLAYDNENIYKYPFKLSYWRNSLKELDSVKKITTLTMLFAMMQVVRYIPLPSGFGNLGLSKSLLFFVVIGMIYGPSISFMVGIISDIFGFFMFPTGYPFHFGYTLQAGLIGFTYGICFYKTKLNFSKCLLSRLLVNLFFNAILGSLCWADVANLSAHATKLYIFTLSMPKNIAYLIPQTLLVYLGLKALVPALKPLGLVNEQIADDFIKIKSEKVIDDNVEI